MRAARRFRFEKCNLDLVLPACPRAQFAASTLCASVLAGRGAAATRSTEVELRALRPSSGDSRALLPHPSRSGLSSAAFDRLARRALVALAVERGGALRAPVDQPARASPTRCVFSSARDWHGPSSQARPAGGCGALALSLAELIRQPAPCHLERMPDTVLCVIFVRRAPAVTPLTQTGNPRARHHCPRARGLR